MTRSTTLRHIFTFLFILGIAYGTTYQQFRHFDFHDPRGADDSRSYVSMAQGNQNVFLYHKYRFIIPSCVKALSSIFSKNDTNSIILFFYITNFTISCLTAFVLCLYLERLGFSYIKALIGVTIFLSSRILILATGTPLVDSIYFLSIVLIVYLMVSEHFLVLLLLYPFFIFTKETIIPFMFLPLLLKNFYTKKNLILFIFIMF